MKVEKQKNVFQKKSTWSPRYSPFKILVEKQVITMDDTLTSGPFKRTPKIMQHADLRDYWELADVR